MYQKHYNDSMQKFTMKNINNMCVCVKTYIYISFNNLSLELGVTFVIDSENIHLKLIHYCTISAYLVKYLQIIIPSAIHANFRRDVVGSD